MKRSKYWRKVWAVDDASEIIGILRREFADEKLKPVIIPAGDAAAIELDNHLDELREKFILGSFNNEQGRIPELMNKFSQVDFVRKYLGLNMAESFIVDLPAKNLPEGLEFPCLVKPVLSAEGHKSDIRKLADAEELRNYLEVLADNGYSRILVQKFLDIDYEFCLSGCCGECISYFVSKTVRAWPNVGGTGSWDRVMDEQQIHELCMNVLKKLSDLGYSGLIDIELFKAGEKIYLCEINWRDSGRVFMCIGTKIYYPLIWYFSVTGHADKIHNMPLTTHDTSQFGMCEESDIRHVFHSDPEFPRLSLRKWLADVKRSQSFSVWYSDDKKPSLFSWPKIIIAAMLPSSVKKFIKKILGM